MSVIVEKEKEKEEENAHVVIEINDYNNETNCQPNFIRYDATLLLHGLTSHPEGLSYNNLQEFTRNQLDSIHFFAAHHDLPVHEAVRYKLLCHCCGNKLNQFGTDICSIRCADLLLRNKNNCMHGKDCAFCNKASIMLLNKESRDKAWEMTNNVLGMCSGLVDLEKGKNGSYVDKV